MEPTKFAQYFLSQPHGSKAKMAESLGVTRTWLSQVIYARKKPSAEMAVAIERLTSSAVTRADLRPDLYL
jgi:DNA-binding transcriptional regulator YdaS (Cro superfamily)